MASVTGKKWVVAKNFDGLPKVSDFRVEEEKISTDLKPGEIIVEALYLTVDPYMRGRQNEIGSTLIGEQVARVKVSNNPDYPVGSLVQAYVGWRTVTLISDPGTPVFFSASAQKIPDIGKLPPSVALGVLGMPGLTAYFGLLERGKPKAGETILVSGAAGAVGSVVGQIAKIKGLTVIGSAGSADKVEWLKKLGFDHVFNYKEKDINKALKEFAPDGVDLYFDNVGGEFSHQVYANHLKFRARVIVCGAISLYNDQENKEPSNYRSIIYNELDVLGIIVSAHRQRYPEALADLLKWIKEGKLQYKETITEGFDKMPEAFISLFKGGNTGKAVVKV